MPITGITWASYRELCGYDAFMKSPRQAKVNFNSKFFHRGVSWDGYVTRVNLHDENPLTMVYQSASLLIKMD